jgi:hypothetical protein
MYSKECKCFGITPGCPECAREAAGKRMPPSEKIQCGGGCGRTTAMRARADIPWSWATCNSLEPHPKGVFFCASCWGAPGSCGPEGCVVTARVSAPRGERVQVECPDCDNWVVLEPNEKVDEGMEIGKKAAADHYGQQPIASCRALHGVCSRCEAVLGLVLARTKKAAPPATA